MMLMMMVVMSLPENPPLRNRKCETGDKDEERNGENRIVRRIKTLLAKEVSSEHSQVSAYHALVIEQIVSTVGVLLTYKTM